ncbi:MAG: orotidine-5'-phosphate decarboxylase [Deltaproteobacteria bacterium]|nr:orotidine-5'-phosphate decarboxylase [Deltaproteobacteria bacterium]
MSAKEHLALALDTPRLDVAEDLVRRTREVVGVYKIGLEMFTAYGPKAVERIKNLDVKVFLDLKLHDIPHTVAGAVKSASNLGVNFLTLHGLGGKRMMQAAVEARNETHLGGDKLQLLAVSILTHHAANELEELGLSEDPDVEVKRLVSLATQAGISGCVCSPEEAALIREAQGADFFIVTPGIRPDGAARGDQSRTATPQEAVVAGSNLLVVGRPIRTAPDPKIAAQEVLDAIAEATAKPSDDDKVAD